MNVWQQKSHFEAMNRAIVATRMQPVVDQIYTFAPAREALKCMETGSHFANTVIQVVA